MPTKALLFLNGSHPKNFKINFEQYKLITCTDGAYTNYVNSLDVKIDYISGDLDSIDIKKVPDSIKIIETPDQNKTDFDKALELLIRNKIKSVDVYGSDGKSSDHFIGNLSTALKFKSKIEIKFYADNSYFFYFSQKIILNGVKNKTISLIPMMKAEKITTKGLLYKLKNEDLTFGDRIGTRNKAIRNIIEVTYKKGNLLIYVED